MTSSSSPSSGAEPWIPAAFRRHLDVEEAFGTTDYLVPGEGPKERVIAASTQSGAPASSASTSSSANAGAATTSSDPSAALDDIARRAAACTACSLHATRTCPVPGQGASSARLMFVGEAPGFHEDRQGLAFVGKSGDLLTKMITAMGLAREDVFIANILKCRPPDNRDPRPEETASCFPFLDEQIATVAPQVICTLGAHAARGLLGRDERIGLLRGRVFDRDGVQVVPTYHPSYLLRNTSAKRDAWSDLQIVMSLLG